MERHQPTSNKGIKGGEGTSKNKKRVKIKPCLFSFFITLSNLVTYVPVAMDIFGSRQLRETYTYLLIWVDPIFNPITYILFKRGKRIRELSRSLMKQLGNMKRRSSYAVNFHVSFKKSTVRRNSKTDSCKEIGIINNELDGKQ